MNYPSNRAWKFVFQGFEKECGDECGISTTPSGGIGMISGDRSIRQSILMLLSVSPGERVMLPEYGCNLHKLAFSANDETTAGLAIHYVRQAIQQWEKRARILNLDAYAHPDIPERLDIVIEYKTVYSVHTQTLTYSLDLVNKED